MPIDSLQQTIGHSTVVVEFGDILRAPVDVIVSSDDVNLSMNGGVSKAIREAGGEAIRTEAQRSKPAPLGSVVVTGAGALGVRFVFHTAVLDYSLPDRGVSEDVVRLAVRACFQACVTRGVRSIAFPALATGTARLSPEQSASAILVETCTYLRTEPPVEHVRIVLYEQSGGVGERFYLKAKQYLALFDATTQVHSAAESVSAFSPTARLIDTRPESLDAVRKTLNLGLVEAPTDEFVNNVAPRVSQTLDDTITELLDQMRTARDAGDSMRLRADTLRLQRAQAFGERQRLEWEDTAAGKTSAERSNRKEFLQAQEKKFEKELLELERQSRPVVISIHGIRTRGVWQKEITPSLNYAGFTHVPLDYGRFGLFRFLWRPARQKQVDDFRDNYQRHGANTASGNPSLIAHSLGSYIVTEAMAKYSLRFDKMVLCGAIVKRDYDWDTAHAHGFVSRVLNDHGRLDIWARLAELALSDAGPSGLAGFTRTANGRVVNRDHARFGHSDYFYEQNYAESWIPFLEGQEPAPLLNLAGTKANRKIWLTVGLLILAGLAAYFVFR